MAKYIEREAILDLLKNKYQDMSAMPASYYKGFQYALKTIEKIKPAADVAPERYGVWEYEPPTINTYGMLKCSKCGWWTLDQSVCDVYHYCPNCGCKMDLEGKE